MMACKNDKENHDVDSNSTAIDGETTDNIDPQGDSENDNQIDNEKDEKKDNEIDNEKSLDDTPEDDAVENNIADDNMSTSVKYMNKTDITNLKDFTTASPNKEYKIYIWSDAQNSFYYSVSNGNVTLIEPSAIGLKLNEADLTKGLIVEGDSLAFSEIDETYETITLSANTARNHCNQTRFTLSNSAGSPSLKWGFGLARNPNDEAKDDLDSPGHKEFYSVTTRNGFNTPWRAAIITDNINDMTTSMLISNLNPAPDINLFPNTDYIKPGKVAWSWWSESGSPGNYSRQIEYVDFAAKNGWEYVCLDAGWRGYESRLKDICDYAEELDVGIFVWVNYRDLKDYANMEQLFSKWKKAGVVGSMDYTPVGYKLTNVDETFGFSIAKTVVYESSLQHFAHSEFIYKYYIGLPFLNNVPTTWDKTIVLEGHPGQYASFARNKGNDWFLASMTLSSRKVDLPLDFLDEGEYNAYIYKDNEDGSSLLLEERLVNKADRLAMDLLNNGGFAVMLTKNKIDTSYEIGGNTNVQGYLYYEAESEDNILSGASVIVNSVMCSGGKKVGYVGNGPENTLEFNIEAKKEGTYRAMLYYCTGENRDTYVSVNGGPELELSDLNSGSYDDTDIIEFDVSLKAGTNVIKLSEPTYYAPDFDRLAISEEAK